MPALQTVHGSTFLHAPPDVDGAGRGQDVENHDDKVVVQHENSLFNYGRYDNVQGTVVVVTAKDPGEEDALGRPENVHGDQGAQGAKAANQDPDHVHHPHDLQTKQNSL